MTADAAFSEYVGIFEAEQQRKATQAERAELRARLEAGRPPLDSLRLLTVAEYAEREGITTQATYKRIKQGRLLGVTISTTPYNLNDVLPNGAIVIEVNDNSNAKRGGIQVGDVIVEVNGTKITSSNDLKSYIQKCNEGETLKVKVYRAPGMDKAITDDGIDLTGVDREGSEDYYITVEVTLLSDTAA